jgi:hypothetical protein
MNELNPRDYGIVNAMREGGIPDDTITIIIKCGGRIYSRGVNLEDTQEKTAKVVSVLMQQIADTVDAKGLKAGGSRFDPNNKE